MKPAIGTLFALSLCVFRKEKGLLAIVIFSFGLLCPQGREQNGKVPPTGTSVTAPTVHAVIQAIEDEIYDYGFEEDYSQIGENFAGDPSKWESRMPIYINPEIEDDEGQVIYRLMHYGEIYRVFTIRKNGLVVLDGDPELAFPPTQPSLKTLYMNEGRVRQLKHDWLRDSFLIDTAPESKRVQAASERQMRRTGYSYWRSVVLPNRARASNVAAPGR
jgi:hypothetical protein